MDVDARLDDRDRGPAKANGRLYVSERDLVDGDVHKRTERHGGHRDVGAWRRIDLGLGSGDRDDSVGSHADGGLDGNHGPKAAVDV